MNVDQNPLPRETSYPFDIPGALAALESGRKPVVAVVGDYCLDKYLFIDARLEEPSVETGLAAHQVRRKGLFPGAAGTIAGNLAALGAEVRAVGLCGDDGEGYELLRGLEERRIDARGMVKSAEIFTSTYIKPIFEKDGTARELNRLDIRNASPAPENALEKVKTALRETLPQVDAVAVADQFTFESGSVLGGDLPDLLAELAETYPEKFFMVDSRSNAARYRNLLVKCNAGELLDLVRRLKNPSAPARVAADLSADRNESALLDAGRFLARQSAKPILTTRGSLGAILFDGEKDPVFIPAVPVDGPIDICGAGDATNAGLLFARALGVPLPESALIAGIVSSITIRQIGVTGTASLDEVVRILRGYCQES
ncbi:MAG: hypothetical protein IK105_00450 [Thermoguttaceae bacterium]|nr:hypothetical protein [Thermoguttaceae bacterium]